MMKPTVWCSLSLLVAMSSAIAQRPGGFRECGGELTNPSGLITSPGYPMNYPNDALCMWIISAAEMDIIDIRFESLDLYGNQFSCSDHIDIFDGPDEQSVQLLHLCQYHSADELSSRMIRSTGNKLNIIFYSDWTTTRRGFLINYWTHECNGFTYGLENCNKSCNCSEITSEYCNNLNGTCVCKKGWSGLDCSQDVNECLVSKVELCGDYQTCVNTAGSYDCECAPGLVKNESGQCHVADAAHCSNKTCSHLCAKTLSDALSTPVEETCYCPNDMVLTGDDCEACLKLKFGSNCRLGCDCVEEKTDKCDAATGECKCLPQWTSANCSQDLDECLLPILNCPGSNKQCVNTYGGFNCTCVSGYLLNNMDVCETSCNYVLNGENGTLMSPNYPENYYDRADCTWQITVPDNAASIVFNVSDLKLEPSFDQLIVHDGSAKDSPYLAFVSSVGIIRSTGNVITVRFTSDGSITHRGFFASYYLSDLPGCGHVLNASSGVIESPKYPPETFHSCYWAIKPLSSGVITLNLTELDIDCMDGYVDVYGYVGAYGYGYPSQLGHYCNPAPINLIRSQFSFMHIQFYSIVSNTSGDFTGSYLAHDCPHWKYGPDCSTPCQCLANHTAKCDNSNGLCTCQAGWTSADCSDDIDECLHSSCPASSTCINSEGGYACSVSKTGPSGQITCADYPSNYHSLVNYYWTITGDPNTIVSFKLSNVSFHSVGNCYTNNLTIYDGDQPNSTLIGSYCGSDIPRLIRTTGNVLHMTLKFGYGLISCLRGDYLVHTCLPFTFGPSCQWTCRCMKERTDYCENRLGLCLCKPGWTGRDCSKDVNECRVAGSHNCLSNAVCKNIPGSYECQCLKGYTMNQGQCVKVEDCPALWRDKYCSHACFLTDKNQPQCACPERLVLRRVRPKLFVCVVPFYPYGEKLELIKVDKFHRSDQIILSYRVPFGRNETASSFYVMTNGVILFDQPDMSCTPNISRAYEQKQKMVAALWAEMDTSKGDVHLNLFEKCGSLELHELQASKMETEVMQRAERDIKDYYNVPNFEASTVIVVSWDKVRQPKKKDLLTFQAVYISGLQRELKNGRFVLADEDTAFVLLIYQAGKITWPVNGRVPVGVGYANKDGYSDIIEGDSNSVNTLYETTWIPGSTDKGVVLFELGSFGGPEKSCQNYLCQQSSLLLHPLYQREIDELYKCPCTMDRLGLQWQLYETRGDIKCYAISNMVKRRLLPHNLRNKLCCYKLPQDSTDDWVTQMQGASYLQNSPDGGHILISDPWDSADNSQLAKEQLHAHKSCCSLSSPEMCHRFYKVFPDKQCSNLVTFIPAFAIGDPHITTCDGLTYAMNGLGEFILMSVPADNFTLQGRTGRAETSNGTLTNATVFTAFAAKESTNASFQVELAINNKTMAITVDGLDKTNDFYGDREFTFFTNSMCVTRENKRNITVVKVNFAIGVAFEVQVGLKNLEISLHVEAYAQNRTIGLMGNCNGNVSDDFLLPDETLLSLNSRERQILEQFVKQYIVTADTTVFTNEEGSGYQDFIDNNFQPYFGDELEMEVLSSAQEFCDADNYACIFDYALTGDENFAKNTKASTSQNEVIVNNLENQTPVIQSITGTTFYNKRWTVTMGKENILQVTAIDSDGDGLSYQIDANSTNITVDDDGMITFTPADYNLSSLQIKVKDSKGGHSSAELVSLVYCSDCSGHGLCNNVTVPKVNNKLTCHCNPAYTGEDCEQELDACKTLPCQSGRNCTDLTAAEQGNNTIGCTCGPCPSGFEDGLDESCLDIDECEDESACDQNCTNTHGSFECTCQTGFRLDERDGITCIDINECEEKVAVCQQICENIDGSYNCSCNDGYTRNIDEITCMLESKNEDFCRNCDQVCILTQETAICSCYNGYEQDPNNNTQCIDINECTQENMPCSQNCTNTEGHFQCSCYAGYQLAEDGITCTSCEPHYFGDGCRSRCECNTHGTCDPVQGCICGAGWVGDKCDQDVDECLQDYSCPDGQVCENDRGTFHCVCHEGFKKQDGICVDIDECAELEISTTCNTAANETCINTQGSYTCACRNGFTHNLFSVCEDVDECLIGIDGCEQKCENMAGGYNCKCYAGFRKAEDRHLCVDVKELCKKHNLGCTHGCRFDKYGNPVCICSRGYYLQGINRCEDINECTNSSLNLCSFKQGCLNTNGSHICSCPDGQKLDNDDRTCIECDESTWGLNCIHNCSCGFGSIDCDPATGCICRSGFTGQFCSEDVDECAMGQLTCPSNEVCVNLPGSSRCQCREGLFKKNGVCIDINECEDKRLHGCKQVCTNSFGGFNCSCYPGYAYDDITNTCTDINECDINITCREICTNTEGSYRCSCPSGQPLQPDGITCGVRACLSSECPEHLKCRILNNPCECVCFNGLRPNSDLQCEDCNRVLTEKTGTIMSSFYPHKYPDNSNCTWTISIKDTNAIILLSIDQFDVEGCPFDYLEIYDGPSADDPPLGQYCDVAPGTVKSTGNSMHIVFYSDSSENRNGFIGSYVADSQCRQKNCSHTCEVLSTKPWREECRCSEWMRLDETGTTCLEIHACNTTINESSGYLVSPGYPENYPDATCCYWTIEAVENAVITLSFSAFALESGGDCTYDYVQVFEGTSQNATQLGLYCGSEMPLASISTSTGMHIIFKSDDGVNSGGFKAQFFIS